MECGLGRVFSTSALLVTKRVETAAPRDVMAVAWQNKSLKMDWLFNPSYYTSLMTSEVHPKTRVGLPDSVFYLLIVHGPNMPKSWPITKHAMAHRAPHRALSGHRSAASKVWWDALGRNLPFRKWPVTGLIVDHPQFCPENIDWQTDSLFQFFGVQLLAWPTSPKPQGHLSPAFFGWAKTAQASNSGNETPDYTRAKYSLAYFFATSLWTPAVVCYDCASTNDLRSYGNKSALENATFIPTKQTFHAWCAPRKRITANTTTRNAEDIWHTLHDTVSWILKV